MSVAACSLWHVWAKHVIDMIRSDRTVGELFSAAYWCQKISSPAGQVASLRWTFEMWQKRKMLNKHISISWFGLNKVGYAKGSLVRCRRCRWGELNVKLPLRALTLLLKKSKNHKIQQQSLWSVNDIKYIINVQPLQHFSSRLSPRSSSSL